MSERIPSVPEKEDRYEEDFEDLDPVKPGGEPGASGTNAVISSQSAVAVSVSRRRGVRVGSLVRRLIELELKSGGSHNFPAVWKNEC